ncbi:MAG: zinc transporter ZupT [Prosthecochloris sp.]|uniref:zinc transporter ZupT n=1 Tax=Prosthecochloris sp. ZM_2 TaxID=2045206 RepID=UPI000DF735B1|nr:zinc transporter ZupT [Prosthecochloris sp. ZM_2]MEC9487850.1 zinc transporter ZupT [Prosthecochloris sp.]RNA64741.1 zinc transporter ZupT [Prosthecochloris sp. ZM_2]
MSELSSPAFGTALTLTLLAGLSTGIGSALAFLVKHTNKRFLTFSLGFSAGIMLYVSFVEIIPEAQESMHAILPESSAAWIATAAFFGGIALIWLIDQLVPEVENPHEMSLIGEMETGMPEEQKLYRMGLFTAMAIAIHNFPEGLAVFFSALSDQNLGIVIATTIALHNIPEGMAVAVPVYFATRNRMKAFSFSFLSGLAEPAGGLIGFLLLKPFLTPLVLSVILAGVAGIMVYISLDELLPTAEEYGEHHLAISGLIVGMGVMAVSLLLLA